MTVKMDDTYAAALRSALVDQVERSRSDGPRRSRSLMLGAGTAVVLLGGGVAVASGTLTLPGADVVRPLAASVTQEGAGTATVDLGSPPAGSTVIDIGLTCLSAGTFYTEDGASLRCDAGDAGSGTIGWQLPLRPGQQTTTIRASDGERWRLVATYSDVSTTAWGVNADGLTYGVVNSDGTPDLLAVVATNGRTGYVYSRDLAIPAPTGLQTGTSTTAPLRLPVYQPDGRTVIGEFVSNEPPVAVPSPG
jgi:hypothetical protein